MNWRRIRMEFITFITSITIPVGIILGSIFAFLGYPYGLPLLIAGIVSVPIYVWNVKEIRGKRC